MLSLLDDYNLGGLIKGPLGGGLFTGKYKDESKVPRTHGWHGTNFAEGKVKAVRDKLEELRELLVNDGRTLAQAALGYIWAKHNQVIPIPGFKNIQQVEENAGAMEFGSLPKNLFKQVEDLLADIKIEYEGAQQGQGKKGVVR